MTTLYSDAETAVVAITPGAQMLGIIVPDRGNAGCHKHDVGHDEETGRKTISDWEPELLNDS